MSTAHAPDSTRFPDDESRAEKVRYRVVTPVVRYDRGGRREATIWHPIGMAWENPGKNGRPPNITIKLNSLPFSGELVLFRDEGRPDEGDEAGTQD